MQERRGAENTQFQLMKAKVQEQALVQMAYGVSQIPAECKNADPASLSKGFFQFPNENPHQHCIPLNCCTFHLIICLAVFLEDH